MKKLPPLKEILNFALTIWCVIFGSVVMGYCVVVIFTAILDAVNPHIGKGEIVIRYTPGKGSAGGESGYGGGGYGGGGDPYSVVEPNATGGPGRTGIGRDGGPKKWHGQGGGGGGASCPPDSTGCAVGEEAIRRGEEAVRIYNGGAPQ